MATSKRWRLVATMGQLAGFKHWLGQLCLASFGNAYNHVTDLGVAWHAWLRFKAPLCTLQTRCCLGLKTFIVRSTEGAHRSDGNATREGPSP